MPAHQRSTSTQDNYPSYAPELVKNGNGANQNQNRDMRRSLDNYTQIGSYQNQRPFQQQINYQNPNQINSSANFTNNQFSGNPSGSLNKLPKYGSVA